MAPLPLLFMVLASGALLAALFALFSSLRTALASASDEGVSEGLAGDELPDRAALIDEKKSLLRAIKDLEYEHAVGKIAAEDFARLNQAYRVRAKEVLALLEKDLLPYQARAEAMIAEAIGKSAGAPGPAAPADEKVADVEPPASSESALRDRARALREEAERLERLAATVAPEQPSADGVHEIAPGREEESS